MRIRNICAVAVGNKAGSGEFVDRLRTRRIGAGRFDLKTVCNTGDVTGVDLNLDTLTDIQQIFCLQYFVKSEEVYGQATRSYQFAGACNADESCCTVACLHAFEFKQIDFCCDAADSTAEGAACINLTCHNGIAVADTGDGDVVRIKADEIAQTDDVIQQSLERCRAHVAGNAACIIYACRHAF